MCVQISIVQLTRQITKVEIDAFEALFLGALDVTHANIVVLIPYMWMICNAGLIGRQQIQETTCSDRQNISEVMIIIKVGVTVDRETCILLHGPTCRK